MRTMKLFNKCNTLNVASLKGELMAPDLKNVTFGGKWETMEISYHPKSKISILSLLYLITFVLQKLNLLSSSQKQFINTVDSHRVHLLVTGWLAAAVC
jgi:hypothetical protein